ncbi:MAG TPA: hypothetical protein VMQ81_06910 [Acidimicrobiia bacterium]|nr:hypothetical protein [Acidimicrobiia bacterium]
MPDEDSHPPVEVDAEEAREWMLAVAAGGAADTITVDAGEGIFADRVTMLDFDPDDLDHIRRLVPHARVAHHPAVESAIAIAGSTAQGRVQLFPGDVDFFERAHIKAPDEAKAHRILREVLWETALRARAEPDIVLLALDYGAFREPVRRDGKTYDAGRYIEWTTEDLLAGEIAGTNPVGEPVKIRWDDTVVGGGWVYLAWIAADRQQGRIALMSNMVDATWEAPDGSIHPLDGAVDPLSQEVYLELEALPLVAKLDRVVAPDARAAYADAMRDQVAHYLGEPSYGKVAKRLYNLFRVTDELEAAAYVRELFDEPRAQLYQVSGLLDAADAAFDESSGIEKHTVMRQLDVVATAIRDATEGEAEAALLASLERLRAAALEEGKAGKSWADVLDEVSKGCAAAVNEFFRATLLAHPTVRGYVESLGA